MAEQSWCPASRCSSETHGSSQVLPCSAPTGHLSGASTRRTHEGSSIPWFLSSFNLFLHISLLWLYFLPKYSLGVLLQRETKPLNTSQALGALQTMNQSPAVETSSLEHTSGEEKKIYILVMVIDLLTALELKDSRQYQWTRLKIPLQFCSFFRDFARKA